jgi:hypothetical protein
MDTGGRIGVRACEGLSAAAARDIFKALSERHGDRLALGEAVVSYGDPGSGPQGVLSYVVVPVNVAGTGVGALYVDRLPDADRAPFGRLELHFLGAVGAQVAALLAAEAPASETAAVRTESPFSGVVTRSRRMLDVLDILKRVASASSTILLQGETGTGKGLIAYEVSRWSDGPFVIGTKLSPDVVSIGPDAQHEMIDFNCERERSLSVHETRWSERGALNPPRGGLIGVRFSQRRPLRGK